MSALPILDIQENSFHILTENFNSVLSKVGDRPFALISINGATRTGKSFALNYFIRYLTSAESGSKGEDTTKFLAKSGRMRTTLGIDLWSEPFIIKVDGREVAVLLMDCQGLFDEQTTGTQNAIIFSLSSLCSSMSIFNLMRDLDKSILQKIQPFSRYAHLASQEKKTKKKEEEDMEAEAENGSEEMEQDETGQSDPFQRLIFLIRDFDFLKDYDFGYHGNRNRTSDDGKGNFYRDIFEPPAKVAPENVFTREEILESYKDVGCYLLPHPGKQFTQNEDEPTDEDFEQYMKEFVELVLSPEHLTTKRIGGQEITGNEFKRFVEEWARLYEKAEDHFPAVQTIYETTVLIQNTLAVNTALIQYEKAMNSFAQDHPRGLSDSDFLKVHEKLQSESLEVFNGIHKISGENLTEEYRQSLIELTTKFYESSRQLNLILLSKTATDEELEKNKQKVNEVHGKLNDLEVQNKRDKEQQEKLIRDLQEKMDKDSTANEEQRKFYQEQMTLAQNKYSQLTQATDEEKKSLTEQIEEHEERFQESKRRHEEAIQESKRKLEQCEAARKRAAGRRPWYHRISPIQPYTRK